MLPVAATLTGPIHARFVITSPHLYMCEGPMGECVQSVLEANEQPEQI